MKSLREQKNVLMISGMGIDHSRGSSSFSNREKALYEQYIKRIEKALDLEIPNRGIEDSLANQLKIYTYNAVLCGRLLERKINPGYILGYSMGIYNALLSAGCVEFETGAALLKAAYTSMQENCLNVIGPGMGFVVGLEKRHIKKLLSRPEYGNTNLSIVNNPLSIVISGERVRDFLDHSLREGAIQTKEIPSAFPYHSPLLKKAGKVFLDKVDLYSIACPRTPLLSLINQKPLTTEEEIKKELGINLYSPISLLRAVKKAESLGMNTFVDTCGSLAKNGRFINKNSVFYTCTSGKYRSK